MRVANPGDTVKVTVYFSAPASEENLWYLYNSADGWSDYSEYAEYAADRKSIVLTFKDGGYGDADGIANNLIADPGGSAGIASFVDGQIYDIITNENIGYATVTIEDFVVKTLIDGHYLTMILPGQYSFMVAAEGYIPLNQSVVIQENLKVTKDFGLEPAGDDVELTAVILSPSSNTTILAGESVNFQCSVFNGNEPLAYVWDFGGGAGNTTEAQPGSVIFSTPGTYTVTLTVTDSDSNTSSDVVTVTVNSRAGDGNGGGGGGGCFLETLRY
jgi:PKD repeat protein